MTRIFFSYEAPKDWIPPSILAAFEAPDQDAALQLLRQLPILKIRSITAVQTSLGSDCVQLRGPYQQHIQMRLPLTPRQKQILHLLEQGITNKEIARSLQLSHFTVRNHVTGILRAAGVRSRRELQRLAARDRTRCGAGRYSESHITVGFWKLR